MKLFSPNTIAAASWLLPKLGRVVVRLVAFVLTPLALFVVAENWRGNHAWQALQNDLKSRGEPLDWAEYQPRPVPDDQNFFKTPLAARMLGLIGAGSPAPEQFLREINLARLFECRLENGPGDWDALVADLKKVGLLAKDYAGSPAAGIALALQPAQPYLDELRDAARSRPSAAPPPMQDPSAYFTHVSTATFQPVRALNLRARAAIELGRFDDAFADIVGLTCIARHLTARPTLLLGLLLSEAARGLAAGAISQGCQRHAWTDAQLREFQTELGRLSTLETLRQCLRAEQVVFGYVLDHAELSKHVIPNPRPWWMFHGWVQQNKVAWSEHLDRFLLPTYAANPDRVFVEKIAQLDQQANELKNSYSPYQWVSRLAAANHGRLIVGIARQVESAHQVVTLCALERFRLTHGSYPEQLAQLAPTFLPAVPLDVFSGQPSHYTKLPSGRLQLSSIGPNGRDDEGKDDDIILKLPDASP